MSSTELVNETETENENERDAVTKWELPNLFKTNPIKNSQHSNTSAIKTGQSEFDRGREAGFEQGRQEGIAAAAAEMSQNLNASGALLQNLTAPISKADTQVARELLQLAVRLAETVIHKEVDSQPELIEKQVAEAIATMGANSSDVSIRLHPEDAKILSEQNASTEDIGYRIVSDDSLYRGGCVLTTSCSMVDATIEKQLKDLTATMLNNLADGSANSADAGSDPEQVE